MDSHSVSADLNGLIELVRARAVSGDPLAELGQADQIVAELADTADAVVRYFVEECRYAGKTWAEISSVLGVSKQAAHKRFMGSLRLQPQILTELTADARRTLASAAQHARARGNLLIDAEHLLLALFDPPDSEVARVLERVLRKDFVEARLPPKRLALPCTGELPFSTTAIDVVTRAREQALNLGHGEVGPQHLLLSLAANSSPLPAYLRTILGESYARFKECFCTPATAARTIQIR